MRKYLVGFAALVAILILATGVYASIPAADGTIAGCYRQSSGALRVIDVEAGQSCMKNETSLRWDAKSASKGYTTPRFDSDATGPIPPGQTRDISRHCRPDEFLIEGGYYNFGPSKILAANPFIGVAGDADAVGFRVRAVNNSDVQDDNGIYVTVICAKF